MPKFNPGDIVLFHVIGKLPPKDQNLEIYDASVVEVRRFEGNITFGARLRTEGDWYTIRAADSYEFHTREICLSLPPHFPILKAREFYLHIGYTPPPLRRVRVAANDSKF